MSVWDRLRSAFGEGPAPDPPERSAASQPEPEAAPREPPRRADPRLGLVGMPGGPSEDDGLRALAQARGTPDEGEALAALAPAATERRLERLALACAEAYAQRGQAPRAIEILGGASSGAALLLLADLLEEGGDAARAMATLERVLARDLSSPGAEERHTRLRARLGGRQRRALSPSADTTLVTPRAGKDRFRILREVARGGAGVVFEAEELPLSRRVAFKLYHSARGAGGEKARREALLREVRATVRLRGPGVVRLYDVDPEEGWISYEWIARASLRELLRGPTDELTPLRQWALPLARSLAALHAAGFVHGDLKPANVLLRAPDDPVLTDLGLAAEIGQVLAAGSAGYESAERLVDGAALPSEDVYAFGRVLEDVAQRTGDHSLDALARRALAPRGARHLDGAALVEQLSR